LAASQKVLKTGKIGAFLTAKDNHDVVSPGARFQVVDRPLHCTSRGRARKRRAALVIGNSGYAFSLLANPGHDAADIADALRGAGFVADLVMDSDKASMLEAIAHFGDAIARRKGVGFFYYARHGVQMAGENFRVPVGRC
jgi:hypothetical protein